MTFTASLRSEFLKTKRTSVIYLILISAVVVPFVMVFDHDTPAEGIVANGWDHFYQDGFRVFAFLFVPFFFILASTLLMQIEVRNNAWKQVLASPQSLLHVLVAKYIVMQVMAFAFLLIFNLYMVIGCSLVDMIYGVNYLTYLNRWPELLNLNLRVCGSTLGISALSFWLALRSKNFIAPVAIGFLLWLIGPTTALELKWPHFDKYIFVLPFTIMPHKFPHDPLFYQMVSLGYGVLFFVIAYLEFALQRVRLRSLLRKPG